MRRTGSARTVLAIVNPQAGAGRCGRRAAGALASLCERAPDIDLDIRRTEGPGDAQRLAGEGLREGFREFLAVGGDGTVFEVVNGLLDREPSVDLRFGALPLGTGNSLVMHFGVSTDDVIRAVAAGTTHSIDVLRIDHQQGTLFALSTITLGLPTLVARTVNRRLKPLRGAAYHAGALVEIARQRNFPLLCSISFQGEKRTFDQLTPMLALQNTRTFGRGMRVAPDAAIDDGLGDLVVVDPVSRWQLLRTLPKIYSGRHVEHPAVHLARFESVDFQHELEELVMIDGEVRRLSLETVRVLPRKLPLFV